MSRESVVLTGFMATGKSTVGRLLAEALGYRWVDTDAIIEERYGSIVEIFRVNGEEAFRDIESQVATELAGRTGLVISTGGRMMLDPENAALLGRSSRVFCLAARPGEILRRVESQEGPERPLLAGPSPVDRIADLLAERSEAYARFEQVPTDGRTFAEIVADIVGRLAKPPGATRG